MKLAVAIVSALTLCGLLAATSSTTLWVGVACVLVAGAVGWGYLTGSVARVWFVCSVTMLCAFPVITLPQTLRLFITGTIVATAVIPLLNWRAEVPRAFTGWLVYYTALFAATWHYSPLGDSGALLVFFLFAASALPLVIVGGTLIRRDEVPILIAALFTGVLAQVAVTCVEVFGLKHPLWNVRFEGRSASAQAFQNTLIDGVDRGTGTFGHPLPQSFLYVVVFAVAITLGHRVNATVRWGVYLLCIAGALLGSARSALLAIAVVIVVATLYKSVVRTALIAVAIGVGLVATDDKYEWLSVIGLDKFSTSGSYTHRVGVISALPDVLNRPLPEVLIGHGVRGQSIILNYLSDNVSAIDNQYISAVIMAGLIGFVALVYVFITAWRATREVRLVIVGMAMMFLSFDVYSWQSTLAITAAVIGIATSRCLDRTPQPSAQSIARPTPLVV